MGRGKGRFRASDKEIICFTVFYNYSISQGLGLVWTFETSYPTPSEIPIPKGNG